jgi:hypothetical protein
MNRTEIINSLISKYNYKTYLEIGIGNGRNFSAILAEKKIGVDPNLATDATHIMTSDEYFKKFTDKFDLIFIDGLHHSDQVYKDIINAINHINQNGIVVCHDIIPPNEISQKVPRESKIWTGDCWKAFLKLRSEEKNLTMRVIDTDFGIGLIQRGNQDLIVSLADNYADFEKNKEYLLNIISVEEFKKLYL